MGARLVGLALARWAHVSDRAFRVLVKMAHTALDEPSQGQPAGLYFGGHELLGLVLRTRGGTPDSVARSVRYAIDELTRAGAIRLVRRGRSGQHAVYELTLDKSQEECSVPPRASTSLSSDQAQQERSVPPQEECCVPPQQERSVPPRRNAAFRLRNKEEPVEKLRKEEELLTSRSSLACPRATTEDQKTHEENEPQDQLTLRVIPGGRSLTGLGLCVRCYLDHRQIVLATDPQHGSYCHHHQHLAS